MQVLISAAPKKTLIPQKNIKLQQQVSTQAN